MAVLSPPEYREWWEFALPCRLLPGWLEAAVAETALRVGSYCCAARPGSRWLPANGCTSVLDYLIIDTPLSEVVGFARPCQGNKRSVPGHCSSTQHVHGYIILT